MNNELQISELKPASFVNGIQRDLPVSYIVKMISRCIKEERMITREEIVDCWIDVKLHRNVFGAWLPYVDDDMNYKYKWMLKEEIKEKAYGTASYRAIQWFMNNLGAAIIKGKLLVIPIIDIEQKQISQP